jgi:integrase
MAESFRRTSSGVPFTRSGSAGHSGSTRKAAGIPTGSLHILRHTAATLALTATPPVPLHVVAGRLGDDPKTVLDTHAHLLATSDEAAAGVIAEALSDVR